MDKHSGKGVDQPKHYGNVKVVSLADGKVIRGHEAVKAYFEKEEQLAREHGTGITCNMYDTNWNCKPIHEFTVSMGDSTVESGFVSGNDTVEAVKQKVVRILQVSCPPDQMTLYFARRRM